MISIFPLTVLAQFQRLTDNLFTADGDVLPFFHGVISSQAAETLVQRQPDSFLLRLDCAGSNHKFELVEFRKATNKVAHIAVRQ